MRIDNSLDHRRGTHHHQNQIQDSADSLSDIGTQESWEDRLLNKYVRSTRTWKDNMPLEDMASMVKIRCPSSRGEDAIASKVMRRILIENKKPKGKYKMFCLNLLQKDILTLLDFFILVA